MHVEDSQTLSQLFPRFEFDHYPTLFSFYPALPATNRDVATCDTTLGGEAICLNSHLQTKNPSILSWKATIVGWRAGSRLGLVSL